MRCTTTEELPPDPKLPTTTKCKALSKYKVSSAPTPEPLCSQSQSFDVPDQYAEQIHLRREWEEIMERLNDKYGLDYYSGSENVLDWDEEHKYP